MKKFKAAVCGLLVLATTFCLFACGEKRENEVEKIELEAGKTAIYIDHHERTVSGDAYIPETKSFPIVILSHGYNGYKDDFKKEAELFMENGIGALTLTFCGSGERDPSGFGTKNMTLFTEKEDLLAVMDYAKRVKGFDGNMFLLGGSQGGMISAMAAEERPNNLKGMILLYPGLSIPDDWNNRNFPSSTYLTYESIPETIDWWGVTLGRDFVWTLRDLDIYKNMADFTKPVLLMHDPSDGLVPFSYSQRAAETYPHAELISYPGKGHGFTPTSIPDAQSRILTFVNDNL